MIMRTRSQHRTSKPLFFFAAILIGIVVLFSGLLLWAPYQTTTQAAPVLEGTEDIARMDPPILCPVNIVNRGPRICEGDILCQCNDGTFQIPETTEPFVTCQIGCSPYTVPQQSEETCFVSETMLGQSGPLETCENHPCCQTQSTTYENWRYDDDHDSYTECCEYAVTFWCAGQLQQ